MLGRTHNRLPRAVLAAAVVIAVTCSAGPAFAVLPLSGPPLSATASSPVEVKKAEQAAAKADVAALQANLADQVAQFISIGQRIELTRQEVSEAATQALELTSALATAQAELGQRAVQLYEHDPGNLFAMLLFSASFDDFIVRTQYLELVSRHDAGLLDQVRLLHSQSLYVQQSASDRLARLTALQQDADDRRVAITKAIAAEQAKAASLGEDIATLMRAPAPASPGTSPSASPSSKFQPDTVISEANFRAATSMTATDVQTFLDQQPGTLKSYRGPDHDGKTRTAAQMIADASVAWGISPKVILATLQKEQSLLSKTSPSQTSYDWAMGCGKTDSRTYFQYRGFGKQVWFGAYKFKQNADLWKPGATQVIDKDVVIHPTNPGTHAQYRYTPHYSGVLSFWMLYWRYFGDPLS